MYGWKQQECGFIVRHNRPVACALLMAVTHGNVVELLEVKDRHSAMDVVANLESHNLG